MDGDLPTGSFGALLREIAAAPAAEPRAPIAGGTMIGGRFEVVRRLGAGGMGTVYLVLDQTLGREVAIKVHSAVESADETVREARVTARVRHASVVTVYEVGEHDGRVFVAMEYLGGGTLREWLATPRPWRAIVARFVAAGEGLCAAHEAGVVHRDFKPANVLLEGARTCVSDFGLAREVVLGDLAIGSATTSAGTPAYMAPEQHRGEPVTAAADQFAFCVALWEALYGVRPFTGDTRDELLAAVEHGPARGGARDVPARLEAVLQRGLRADPDGRWPSMAALVAALAADPGARRRRLRNAVALAAGAAAAAVGAMALARATVAPRGLSTAAASSSPAPIVRTADGRSWAIHLGSIGSDIIEDAVTDRAGNRYLVGYFTAPLELGGASLVPRMVAGGSGVVVKLDRSGAIAWHRVFSGPSKTVVVRVVVAGERVLVGGHVGGGGTYDLGDGRKRPVARSDAFIASLAADDGAIEWSNGLAASHESFVRAIELGPDGHVYVGGEFGEQATFGGEVRHAGQFTSPYLASYTLAGELRWVFTARGGHNCRVRAIAFDRGDVLLGGSAAGDVDIGGERWSGDVRQPFLAALDPATGAPRRVERFAAVGGELHAIEPGAGGLAIAGSFFERMDLGGGHRLSAPSHVTHGWVAVLDPVTYQPRWSFSIPSTQSAGVRGLAWRDHRLLVAGWFDGAMTLGGRTHEAPVPTTEQFLAMVDDAGAVGDVIVFGATGGERIRRIRMIDDVTIAVMGRYGGPWTLGGLDLPAHGQSDGFYAELALDALGR